MSEKAILDSFIKLTTTNPELQEFKSDVNQVTKEGFEFKPFKKVVDGKLSIRPAITYKKGTLRGFIDSDLKNDHRIYIEKSWTF